MRLRGAEITSLVGFGKFGVEPQGTARLFENMGPFQGSLKGSVRIFIGFLYG